MRIFESFGIFRVHDVPHTAISVFWEIFVVKDWSIVSEMSYSQLCFLLENDEFLENEPFEINLLQNPYL